MRIAGVGRRTWIVPLATLLAAGLDAGCSSSSTTPATSSSSTSTTHAGLSSSAAKAIQSALFAVGCYAGAIDGDIGPATTKALRAFQAADGLTVDGVYGANTKAKLLAAVSAGKKLCSSTSTSTSTTGGSTTTTSGSGVNSAAIAAINAYELHSGPPAGSWQVTSAEQSTVDPTYILFKIGPAPGHENEVQGGYGFAKGAGAAWSVIGFGTADVGCPPGSAQAPVVPTAVLAGFGLTCPSG